MKRQRANLVHAQETGNTRAERAFAAAARRDQSAITTIKADFANLASQWIGNAPDAAVGNSSSEAARLADANQIALKGATAHKAIGVAGTAGMAADDTFEHA